MELAPARRIAILVVALAAFIASPIEFSILEPALPLIQQQYQVTEQAISWTYTLYTMAQMVGAPLLAKLSDARGRRDAFALTMLLFAAGTFVAGVSPDYYVLLFGRTLQGFGAGGIAPIVGAVIADIVPRGRRATVLSSMGIAVGIGLLAGPVIGTLALSIGWQTLFLSSAPLLLGLGIAGFFVMPSLETKRSAPIDFAGVALFVLAVAALMFGLINLHPRALETSPEVVLALALAAALLYVFVRLEQRQAEPFIRPALFRSRTVVLACALALGYGFTRTVLAFLPEYVSAVPGQALTTSAALISAVALAIVVGSPLAGLLVDRIGVKPVVVTGLIAVTAGTLLLSQFVLNPIVLFTAGVLFGLGAAVLVGAPVRFIFILEFPEAERTTGQGLFAIMWALGQQVSGVLLGSLLAASSTPLSGYSAAFLAIGIVLLALTVAAFGLRTGETVRN